MFIEQPARFIRWLYPLATWRMSKKERAVYLTFDDGPIPEATPFVLDILDKYDVKATFFMVGDNVRKHPEVFEDVVRRGHRIGNHTFHHLGSLCHGIRHYLRDIEQADELLHTNLFRPPHGWMKPSVYAAVRMRYKVIMWDLVTRDYSKKLNGHDVLANVKRYARNGSIITFHDSLRSFDKIHYALPRSIEFLLQEGYTFKVFG